MPESLLQKVERFNSEIAHLTEAKFHIMSCQNDYAKILDAIEHEIKDKSEWNDLNSIKAIHSMIYNVLHQIRERGYHPNDHNEEFILEELHRQGFLNFEKVQKIGFENDIFTLKQEFENLPSVEELYLIFISPSTI